MSFIDNKKQENDLKMSLKLTPELKEDYFQDHACTLGKGSIDLWKVVSVVSGDRDLQSSKFFTHSGTF